ncbi:hypothetical protein N7466_007380 [Penicillium verhagenii]|uniref:uncharacterized protein n=1 Tax=Penicillium verhagenii TaxID=1562060 RepID=UPI00254577C4|nr:uncharacterized protein N7466_007380 [Penicillium verhagenii]KAJ5928424.1 hypothetical protein N7466_007380 [Penicillium verhagenii]
MASASIFRLLALSAALGQATASFSLDTSGPSWDYTTKDLADTTSQACKDAYSADIDCDNTLLELVASMDPDFDPQSSDLQAMCTSTCSDSLTEYVKNVNAACDQSGDLAGLASGNKYIYQASVATVGEVFQYKYAQGCATSGSDYCFLTYPASEDWARTEFPCSDDCAIKFFQNAHEQPGSAYIFDYFALGNQSSYWEDTFAGGWDTVVKCGDGGSAVSSASSASSSAASTKTENAETTPSAGSTSTAVAGESTTATSTAATTASPVRSTSGATSATASSHASRLRAPFFFL